MPQAGFLDVPVQLPGGYRTSRRELLKLTSLGTGTACIYVAATRAKVCPHPGQNLINQSQRSSCTCS